MEYVVLVDESDRESGITSKENVHTTSTPLHRGFSVFVFNPKKEALITRRAATKKTFPGILTNSVCGHPGPGEPYASAASRRMETELGYTNTPVFFASPFRYRCSDSAGIFENEICPIFTAFTDHDPAPNPDEVAEWKWIPWKTLLTEMERTPEAFSMWSRQEAKILDEMGIPERLIRS